LPSSAERRRRGRERERGTLENEKTGGAVVGRRRKRQGGGCSIREDIYSSYVAGVHVGVAAGSKALPSQHACGRASLVEAL